LRGSSNRHKKPFREEQGKEKKFQTHAIPSRGGGKRRGALSAIKGKKGKKRGTSCRGQLANRALEGRKGADERGKENGSAGGPKKKGKGQRIIRHLEREIV